MTLENESNFNSRFVERDVFQHVMGHFASGVTVITVRHNETDYGLTASAVTCLSLDPPMLLICVNRKTGTREAIAQSKVFGVNILHEDQGDVAIQFSKPNTDKFAGVAIRYGELGEPLLAGVLANLECRMVEEVTGGTHSIFLAEVQNAWAEEGKPLAYYRGKFGRFQGAGDEAVYRTSRRLVLAREVELAKPLEIAELAVKLDAPRQAIYYAMTRLEAEGLVTREADGSYLVNPLDARSLNDALDTRCALEIAAAEQTVGKLSADELAELAKRLRETMVQPDDSPAAIDRYIEANTSFHDYLVAVAKNATLLQAYRRLTAEAVMTGALRIALEANDPLAREELGKLAADHVELAAAFKNGDLETAKRLIRRHSEEAKRLGRYLIDSAGGSI
ncbi:UNVERIFIED_CONTAM: flavin reductase (DIM6/NTAB) family NADH-FMN oxidoreductase RutF/DNA-binding GntR family transcriptional regulator [Brevibacillus sp. OAP136]